MDKIRCENKYSEALNQLLRNFDFSKVIYGISLPNSTKEIDKAKMQLDKIDFLITTNLNKEVVIHFDHYNIFEKE